MQKSIFSCYISSFSLDRKLEGLVGKIIVVVVSGLTSLSTIFHSHHDGDWLRQGRGLKASLTFKCVTEHLFADFSYSIALDTYL